MTALAPPPAARNPQDMDRVNLSPPTTAADVASVKHGTLHVTRYLRQRWRPEWQRAGLSPTSVQGTFSHLMALRKLQDLERRGEAPEYAGQINRPALGSQAVCARSAARVIGGAAAQVRSSITEPTTWRPWLQFSTTSSCCSSKRSCAARASMSRAWLPHGRLRAHILSSGDWTPSSGRRASEI